MLDSAWDINGLTDEQMLFCLRNYFAALAFHYGLADAGLFLRETLIFNEIADGKDNYKFYRERWHKAPGLPFPIPHIQGPCTETKRQDFLRFYSEYVDWRGQGEYDDLADYVTQHMSGTTSAAKRQWSKSPQFWLQYLSLCLGFSPNRRTTSSQSHLVLEKGSQADADAEATASTQVSVEQVPPSTVGHQPLAEIQQYEGWKGKAKDSRSQNRTCLKEFCLAQVAFRKWNKPWTCDNRELFGVQGLDHKLGLDSRSVHTTLQPLIRPPRTAVTTLQSLLRSFCLCEPFDSDSSYWDGETCVSDLPNMKDDLTLSRFDSCPSPDQHLPPVRQLASTLGHVLPLKQ